MLRLENPVAGPEGSASGTALQVDVIRADTDRAAVQRSNPPGCLRLVIPVSREGQGYQPRGSALLVGPATRYQHEAGAPRATLTLTARPSEIAVAEEPWRREISQGTHILARCSPTVGLITDLLLEPSEQLPGGSLSSGVARVYADPGQWRQSVSRLLQLSFPPTENQAVWTRRRDIVHDACAFLHHHPGQPVGLVELAAAALASERALQYAFQDILGLTPTSYQRVRALHLVRRELRRAGLGETVADIAMRSGFWHLGRFSATYRSLFAELPSATRNQSLRSIRLLTSPPALCDSAVSRELAAV
jgi:AraC-like DNA-binding protein